MTSDPPRPWDDDSPEEDFKAHQAREEDRLKVWMGEQKTRPIRDLLGEPSGQGYSGPLLLPDWWDHIPEPGQVCPWCQRPGVPSPCPECRQARAVAGDPAVAWTRWAALPPALRRLNIAAAYRVDPWSGRRVTIYQEWTDEDPEGQVLSGRHHYNGPGTPSGIYWRTAAAG